MPQSDPRRLSRAVLVWLGASAALVALVLALVPADKILFVDEARLVVNATSDAVVFRPDSSFNLIAAAAPLGGMSVSATEANAEPVVFQGLRLVSALPARAARIGLGTDPRAGDPPGLFDRMRELYVSPGCAVRIEGVSGRSFRLDIQTIPNQQCTLDAELVSADSEVLILPGATPGAMDTIVARDYLSIRSVVQESRPASIRFHPEEPVRFSRLSVAGLAFESQGRSAIRAATMDMPDLGLTNLRAYAGDILTLGRTRGHVMELAVDGTIRTIFNGRAEQPLLRDRALRPSALRAAVFWEPFRLTVALIVGVVGLATAVIEVTVR